MFRPISIRHKFAEKSKRTTCVCVCVFFLYHPLCVELNLPLGFGPLACALILVDERDRIFGTRCCVVCIKMRIHSSTLMLKRHAIHASMSARFIKDRYTIDTMYVDRHGRHAGVTFCYLFVHVRVVELLSIVRLGRTCVCFDWPVVSQCFASRSLMYEPHREPETWRTCTSLRGRRVTQNYTYFTRMKCPVHAN